MVVSDPTQLPIGIIFAQRFEIVKPLGIGLLGAVYRARDLNRAEDLDGSVALKILRAGANAQSLRDEAAILRKLNELEAKINDGRHTAPKYILGSTDTAYPFIAMEFMQGKQVIALLNQSRARNLPEPLALKIGEQLFRLLSILHSDIKKTYIDLKFENLWWEEENDLLRVTDWNVLEEIKENSIARDLFRASLYIYRMLTGELPTLRGELYTHSWTKAARWSVLSLGAQQFLTRVFQPDLAKRFTQATEAQNTLKQLSDWWQQDTSSLFHETNDKLTLAQESPNTSSAALYHQARCRFSILQHRSPESITPDEWRKLENWLRADLSPSFELFAGGSMEAAIRVATDILPQTVNPALAQWWLHALQVLTHHPLAKEDRPQFIAAAKLYAEEKHAAAQKILAALPALATPVWDDLQKALRAQALQAEAQQLEAAAQLNTAREKYEEAHTHLPTNLKLLPESFVENLSSRLQSILKEEKENTELKELLTEGQEYFNHKKYLLAGEVWAKGFALAPQNVGLMQEVTEAVKKLQEQKDCGAAIDLIQQIPSLVLTEELREIRQQIFEALHLKNLELAQREWRTIQLEILFNLYQPSSQIELWSTKSLEQLLTKIKKTLRAYGAPAWAEGDLFEDHVAQVLAERRSADQLESNERLVYELQNGLIEEALETFRKHFSNATRETFDPKLREELENTVDRLSKKGEEEHFSKLVETCQNFLHPHLVERGKESLAEHQQQQYLTQFKTLKQRLKEEGFENCLPTLLELSATQPPAALIDFWKSEWQKFLGDSQSLLPAVQAHTENPLTPLVTQIWPDPAAQVEFWQSYQAATQKAETMRQLKLEDQLHIADKKLNTLDIVEPFRKIIVETLEVILRYETSEPQNPYLKNNALRYRELEMFLQELDTLWAEANHPETSTTRQRQIIGYFQNGNFQSRHRRHFMGWQKFGDFESLLLKPHTNPSPRPSSPASTSVNPNAVTLAALDGKIQKILLESPHTAIKKLMHLRAQDSNAQEESKQKIEQALKGLLDSVNKPSVEDRTFLANVIALAKTNPNKFNLQYQTLEIRMHLNLLEGLWQVKQQLAEIECDPKFLEVAQEQTRIFDSTGLNESRLKEMVKTILINKDARQIHNKWKMNEQDYLASYPKWLSEARQLKFNQP